MSSHDEAEEYTSSVPSMLDLVRLSSRRLFPPGGVDLYRQIALLTELREGMEVLDVAAGKGVPLEYFAEEYGVTASGVEFDSAMVESAETWSRSHRAGDRIQFQGGRSDALPYRDEIFDVAIGEIGLSNHCDPEDAVRELVRVTKPGGFIVLVQLVWQAAVDENRRAVLSDHLGARPLMVVEWKRLLREAGVEDVHVEDWSDAQTAFRPTVVKPFPDFAEMFSLFERLGILRRAWGRWGWRGVRAALAREAEVHKLLTSERILGLDLLRGRKAGDPAELAGAAVAATATVDHGAAAEADRGTAPGGDKGAAITTDPGAGDGGEPLGDGAAGTLKETTEDEDRGDTEGLPLFSNETGDEDR